MDKEIRKIAGVLAAVMLASAAFSASPARAQTDELIGCDTVRNLGNAWRNQQSGRNIGVIACYQVPTGTVIPAGQALIVDFRVTAGVFDVFAIPGAATVGTAFNAQKLNTAAVFPASGPQVLTYVPAGSAVTTIAVAPSVDGTRGSFTLRMRASGAPIGPVPTPIPLPPAGGPIILPTTTDRPCSTAGVNLSDLCIDPYPAPTGGTTYAVWRIANFQSGSFDKGDGRGFIGPIAAQQRVDVPNVTAPRVIRLQWTDLQGRTYIDSLLVPIGGQPAPVPPNVDTFPCSRPGLGVSNLCIEQPYPVKRGTTAYAVWRIATGFQSGSFDKGDGRGFQGPITAEQRVEIPNVIGPRVIQLRWVDSSGVTRTDIFTIQVVD
jgi:hypothetical protein